MSEVKDPALNARDHVPEPVPLPTPPRNPHLPPFAFPVTTDPVEGTPEAKAFVGQGMTPEEPELTPGLEERVEAAMERLDDMSDADFRAHQADMEAVAAMDRADDQGEAQEIATSAPDLRDILVAEADAFEEVTPAQPRSTRRKK